MLPADGGTSVEVEAGSSVEINELSTHGAMKGNSADEIVLGSPTFDEEISYERQSSDTKEPDVSAVSVDVIEEDAIAIQNDAEVESVPFSFEETLESPGDVKSDEGQKSPSKFKFNMPNVNLPSFGRKKDTHLPDAEVPTKEIPDEIEKEKVKGKGGFGMKLPDFSLPSFGRKSVSKDEIFEGESPDEDHPTEKVELDSQEDTITSKGEIESAVTRKSVDEGELLP